MSSRIGALLISVAVIAGCSTRIPDDASGQEIYLQLCARCHGTGLEGRIGPALGPESNAAAEPDEFVVFTVTNGRGRMPSFSSKLGTDQIDRLVAYIREVQSG